MRADGWNRIPLIRMTNINLLPQPGMSLDDIVADTDDGLYLASNRSWSIDDRRLNFQFATEVAYEIKNGKKGRLFKNPTYTGITYEFWRSCDAVGDERSYVMLGTPNCGKGEPGQTGHVGHAVPGARFRERPGRRRQVVSRDGADDDDRQPTPSRSPRRAPRRGAARRRRPRPRRSSWPRTRRSRASRTARSTRTSPRPTLTSTCASSSGKRVGVASSGRIDEEGLRRLAETAGAIARVVEELEDWGGLPEPTPIAEIPAAFADATAGATPELPRRGRPCRDRRGRCRGRDRVRLVRDGRGVDGGRQLEGHPRVAATGRPRSCITVSMGPGGGTGYAEAAAVDASTIDAAAIGREAADKARVDGRRRSRRARRLSGRPRGVRGRRPPGHARLSRVLRARGPGGALVLGARQADRQRPRHDRRRRDTTRRRCRSGSTTRASPSSGSR